MLRSALWSNKRQYGIYITIYIYFLNGRLCEVGAVRRGWPRQRTQSNDVTSFREQRNFFTVFRSIRQPYITFKLPRGDMDSPPRPRNFFRYLAIGMCHFRHLWNGMCDRHRAEITVMQFTGHSLPVHHFVTAQWEFFLPYLILSAKLYFTLAQLPVDHLTHLVVSVLIFSMS